MYVQESLKPLQYIDINIDLRMQSDVLKCLIAITSVLNQYDKFILTITLHKRNAVFGLTLLKFLSVKYYRMSVVRCADAFIHFTIIILIVAFNFNGQCINPDLPDGLD